MSRTAYPRPPRLRLGSTTTTGARGERRLVQGHPHRKQRPTGTGLANLLDAMEALGFPDIPSTGFDAIEIPEEAYNEGFTFESRRMVAKWCDHFIFLEIKTCTQERVDGGFGRFLFTIPESEIRAAEILGDRHVVLLHNENTGQVKRTSIPELLENASTKVWTLAVQLAPTKEVWEGHTVIDLFGGPPEPPCVTNLFRIEAPAPTQSQGTVPPTVLDLFG